VRRAFEVNMRQIVMHPKFMQSFLLNKYFMPLIRKKNATMTAEKLLGLYKAYEGDDKGINFEEYSQFMDDVLGKG